MRHHTEAVAIDAARGSAKKANRVKCRLPKCYVSQLFQNYLRFHFLSLRSAQLLAEPDHQRRILIALHHIISKHAIRIHHLDGKDLTGSTIRVEFLDAEQ